MRRYAPYLAAAALLATAGCSADTEPRTENKTVPAPVSVREDAFVTVLQGQYPEDFMAIPDDKLIEVGYAVCDTFDAGATLDMAIHAGLSSGYSPETTGALLGASVTAFCPQHDHLFD